MVTKSVPSEPGISEQRSRSRVVLRQLARFVIVGLICAVLDFSTYKGFLALRMDFSPLVDIARGVSFVVGTTAAYWLNKHFTFGAPGGIRQASGFTLLYGSTFAVAVGANSVLLHSLPAAAGWRENLAWAISQAMATSINFIMLRLVVFRRHAAQ